jgi:hypothetical protein
MGNTGAGLMKLIKPESQRVLRKINPEDYAGLEAHIKQRFGNQQVYIWLNGEGGVEVANMPKDFQGGRRRTSLDGYTKTSGVETFVQKMMADNIMKKKRKEKGFDDDPVSDAADAGENLDREKVLRIMKRREARRKIFKK